MWHRGRGGNTKAKRFNRAADRVQDHSGVGVDDAVLSIEPGTDAPGLARVFLSCHRGHLPDTVLEDAQLLVSEVVTNAVRHGRSAVHLRVRTAPPGVGVAVADTGRPIAADTIAHPDNPTCRPPTAAD